MSERQQLAEAIIDAIWPEGRSDLLDLGEAVEPFLVAAERAGYERGYSDGVEKEDLWLATIAEEYANGYERCKRDATTRIEAQQRKHDQQTRGGGPFSYRGGIEDALAVLAALKATQPSEPSLPKPDANKAIAAERCASCGGPTESGYCVNRCGSGKACHHAV